MIHDLPLALNFFLAGTLGLIFGSFYNVCIARLPREEGVFWGRSHCPKCSHLISWFENIPVFSYLFLGGKCAHCKERISIQYPLIELLSAALFIWVQYYYGWGLEFVAYTIFHSALLIISVVDLHHRIIPDELSLGGIVVGFLFSFFLPGISWLDSLLGILLGGGFFLLIAMFYEKIAKREGLGGGDIKLLGMIGAWLGFKSILLVVLISSALGSIVGVTWMLVKKGDLKHAIPFGPFLALAAFLVAFLGSGLQVALYPPIP